FQADGERSFLVIAAIALLGSTRRKTLPAEQLAPGILIVFGLFELKAKENGGVWNRFWCQLLEKLGFSGNSLLGQSLDEELIEEEAKVFAGWEQISRVLVEGKDDGFAKRRFGCATL